MPVKRAAGTRLRVRPGTTRDEDGSWVGPPPKDADGQRRAVGAVGAVELVDDQH
jgi:hypothetical protein